MSKTLSYTQFTVYAEQAIRKYLVDAATHEAAGDATRAAGDRSAALAVYEMWDSLVLRHLDPHGRKSFVADYTRLSNLVLPDVNQP